jgi:REP element-mobilizing transposase RayT
MQTGQTYHVFNHANGREDLFPAPGNYHQFLVKLHRHLSDTTDILAFCLMPNHFHLAVHVPETRILTERDASFASLTEEEISNRISKSFSNLFSSHTLTVNRMHGRTGSLFRPNMKTREVDSEISLCKLIHYIHCNPVHHGFVEHIEDWPYSSFNQYKSMSTSRRRNDPVLLAYGGHDAFLRYHTQPIDLKLSDPASESIFLKMNRAKKSAAKKLDLT